MAIETPPGYRTLDGDRVVEYLAGLPIIADRLGGEAAQWRVGEVGDGNLNLVFIVEGPAGAVCVKQALPYVRLVGEGWPLPLERAYFEWQASVTQRRAAPKQTPELLHYDPQLYLIVMERLHPHIILRRGMIDGVGYPRLAEHISEYMAATLFATSDLAMPAAAKKARIALFCGNTALCRITEDLIFTEPYTVHEHNRWTSPQLDEVAASIREDDALKRAVSLLKYKFLTETQALLHGDLHTGSIMVTTEDTRVIDPEFAFYGPIGFDIGKLLGNLLMAYFSQDGHETAAGERRQYRRWILDTVTEVWSGFAQRFIARWNGPRDGEAYPGQLFAGLAGERSLRLAQDGFLRRLLVDSFGYAGASMIRRTLGLAHNIDFEWIGDPDRRAACERLSLELARDLILTAGEIESWQQVAAAARALRDRGPAANGW